MDAVTQENEYLKQLGSQLVTRLAAVNVCLSGIDKSVNLEIAWDNFAEAAAITELVKRARAITYNGCPDFLVEPLLADACGSSQSLARAAVDCRLGDVRITDNPGYAQARSVISKWAGTQLEEADNGG